MRPPSSQERPVKRQKADIEGADEDFVCEDFVEQQNGSVATSPVVEDRLADGGGATAGPAHFQYHAGLPSRTPAVPLFPVASAAQTGVTIHRRIGTTLLQSLQRRFVLQQTLKTPAAPVSQDHTQQDQAEEEKQDEDLEGFVLFSQPTYERVLSQRGSEEEFGDNPQAVEVRNTNCSPNVDVIEEPSVAAEEIHRLPLPPPIIVDDLEEDAGEVIIGSQPSQENAGAPEQHRTTPAVHSVDRVQLNNNIDGVFPVFRSKKDCKIVYIIRHGESEYNAALAAKGSAWAEPLIYDAPLTAKGRRQAANMRSTVASWNLPENTVWITSPLTRAIETMLLARPETHSPNENSALGHAASGYTGIDLSRVVVLPDITERLLTSGDIGRRASELCQHFPCLQRQLSSLTEEWWFQAPGKPNCAARGLFKANETKEQMQRRIKAFRKWLMAREEKVFVAVGHSMYWKAFANACKPGSMQENMRNCGWMKVHV